MTVVWQRRHWVLFGILLACEVLGLSLSASRAAIPVAPLLWLLLAVWIIGSAFLTTLIVIALFDAGVRPFYRGKSALGLAVLWLACAIAGFVLWQWAK